ncbi:MAG: rRNA maturation RNase YbeY [Patescibacteria group bacterium]
MMSILISGPLPRGVTSKDVHDTVVATFRGAKKTATGSLSVQFVTEKKIASLNATYRNKRRSTDVLSFSSIEGKGMPKAPSKEFEWGDLFVCAPYAKREASRRSIPLSEEIIRLVSHGTLHLLGYDHATEPEEAKMFTIQEAVVERMSDDV